MMVAGTSHKSVLAYTSTMGWLFRLSPNVAWIVQFGIKSGAYIAGQLYTGRQGFLDSTAVSGTPEFDTSKNLITNSGSIKLFPDESIYDITITYDDDSTQSLNNIFITTTGWDVLSTNFSNSNAVYKISASYVDRQPLNLETSNGYNLITSNGFRLMSMKP